MTYRSLLSLLTAAVLMLPGIADAWKCTISGEEHECARPIQGELACQANSPSSVYGTSAPQCQIPGRCESVDEAFEAYQDNWAAAWEPAGTILCEPWQMGPRLQEGSSQGWFLGIQSADTYWFNASYGTHQSPEDDCPVTSIPVLAQCVLPIVCPPGYSPDEDTDQCVSRKSEACKEGNPIQCGTGEKLHHETDITATGGSPLEFVRHYSSAGFYSANGVARESGSLGLLWRHSYQQHLVFETSSGSITSVTVVRPDGDYRHFTFDGSAWSGRKDKSEALAELQAGWAYTTADDSVETFDVAGKLISISDKTGQRLDLVYSDASTPPEQAPSPGLLVKVRDLAGRALTLYYTSTGLLRSVVDPTGASVNYEFDKTRLSQVEKSPGSFVSYLYGEPSLVAAYNTPVPLLTGIEDESGNRFASYHYDTYGRADEEWHGPSTLKADELKITYSGTPWSDYYFNTVTDALGTQRTRYFLAVNGIVRDEGKAQPACAGTGCNPSTPPVRTTYTYDANGNPDTFTNFRGIVTDYAFNTRGQETERIQVATCPSDMPNCLQARRKIQTDWHATFRVPAEQRVYDSTNVLAKVTRYTYNPRGQQIARCEIEPTNTAAMAYACGSTNSAPTGVRQTLMDYCDTTDADFGSSACQREGLIKTIDGPRTDVADVTSYAYYGQTLCTLCLHRKGDLWTVTNALGHTTEFLQYDGAGRPTRTKDANGVITELEYHSRGWLTARKVRGTDDSVETDDAITRIDYWPTGLVQRVTQPDGDYLNYEYDEAHRLVAIADALGNRIEYTLDAAGNRTAEATKNDALAITRQLSRVFDQLGRLELQKNAELQTVAEHGYDSSDNLVSTLDALGHKTHQSYDPLERLKQTIQDYSGLAVQTSYAYDALDRVTRVTDPKGLNTDYAYDGLGNLTTLVSPDTGTTSYSTDAAGNRLSQTDARGITATYTYDALNRVSSVTYPDAALNLTYTYDADHCGGSALGQLTGMSDASGSTTYCYDRRGNVTRKMQGSGTLTQTTQYAYTLGDRLKSLTYPSGLLVTYKRDVAGRIAFVTATPAGGAQTVVANSTYLPFGPITRLFYGNDRVQNRHFDANYDIAEISNVFPAGVSLDFTLDALGNPTEVTSGSTGNRYDYDALSRLRNVTSLTSASIESYTYDATGNRLSKTVGGSLAQAYVYPPTSHRLASVDAALRVYDAAGNTTVRGDGTVLTYNAANRLARVQSPTADVSYRHNARGERVRKSSTAGERYFVYDEQGALLGEYIAVAGPCICLPGQPPPLQGLQTQSEYIWLDGLPVGVVRGGVVYYVEPDHLGTPRAVIHPQRNVAVWTWNLIDNPFGEAAPNPNPDGDSQEFVFDLRYPGQHLDAESGLHYNYFRDYEPATGRYVESDPIGLEGGITTYGYATQSPIRYFDESGLGVESMVAILIIKKLLPKFDRPPRIPGKFACNVKCPTIPTVCPEPACPIVFGYGIGNTPAEAVRLAKADANSKIPMGCQGKHCTYKCTGPSGDPFYPSQN